MLKTASREHIGRGMTAFCAFETFEATSRIIGDKAEQALSAVRRAGGGASL
jgi:hypothetical protein